MDAQRHSQRKDSRAMAATVTVMGIFLCGLLIEITPMEEGRMDVPGREQVPEIVVKKEELPSRQPPSDLNELEERFSRAVSLLHTSKYEAALAAFRGIAAERPLIPEVWVNLGYSSIGLEQYRDAAESFNRAIDIWPEQANAYYGLAVALEGLGDLAGALGAMRTFVHRTHEDDPYLRKARSALWEWDELLAARVQEPGQINE